MIKNQAKQVFGWTTFDFANTSFQIIIITVVLPIYFQDYIFNIDKVKFGSFVFHNPSDLFWGIGTSISFLIVAISAPILGAISDLTSRKKKYIFYYSLLCIISILLIYFLQPGDILFAIILLILGNIGFETGLIFYDSFLPIISTEDKYSLYSGYGYAAGYLGALFSLAIAVYFGAENKSVFIATASFFMITSLPFYLLVKEEKKERIATFTLAVKSSIATVKKTVLMIDDYPSIKKFVLAFFFYINGVLTIIAFAGKYATTTLGLDHSQVFIFFAIVQTFAMIGSFFFGYVANSIGEYAPLRFTIILWIIVCIGSFVSSYVNFKIELFFVMGMIAGLSLGSSQSLSRSYFSRMIPLGHEAEFFGFFALCSRFAAILGPFTFGIISSITGSQELAIISIVIFFVTGYVLIPEISFTKKTA